MLFCVAFFTLWTLATINFICKPVSCYLEPCLFIPQHYLNSTLPSGFSSCFILGKFNFFPEVINAFFILISIEAHRARNSYHT